MSSTESIRSCRTRGRNAGCMIGPVTPVYLRGSVRVLVPSSTAVVGQSSRPFLSSSADEYEGYELALVSGGSSPRGPGHQSSPFSDHHYIFTDCSASVPVLRCPVWTLGPSHDLAVRKVPIRCGTPVASPIRALPLTIIGCKKSLTPTCSAFVPSPFRCMQHLAACSSPSSNWE